MSITRAMWAEMKGTGTGRGIETWTEGVMKRPTAVQVAELEITHGVDACQERWYFINPSTLRHMISEGKRELRQVAA